MFDVVVLATEKKLRNKVFFKTNMAAALNRSGLIRLCNTSLRSLSTSSSWTADKSSTASSGLAKKLEMEELETTFPRSKKMAGLITVEGAVDVATTSVSEKNYYQVSQQDWDRKLAKSFIGDISMFTC